MTIALHTLIAMLTILGVATAIGLAGYQVQMWRYNRRQRKPHETRS